VSFYKNVVRFNYYTSRETCIICEPVSFYENVVRFNYYTSSKRCIICEPVAYYENVESRKHVVIALTCIYNDFNWRGCGVRWRSRITSNNRELVKVPGCEVKSGSCSNCDWPVRVSLEEVRTFTNNNTNIFVCNC